MSYNNIIPAWVLTTPENISDTEMLMYLCKYAEKDGMPEHVRVERISRLMDKRLYGAEEDA